MITRAHYFVTIQTALDRSPVCALLGSRQCGKTTLAREITWSEPSTYFDLESPRDQLRPQNPETTLAQLSGLAIQDEIQIRPDRLPERRKGETG